LVTTSEDGEERIFCFGEILGVLQLVRLFR